MTDKELYAYLMQNDPFIKYENPKKYAEWIEQVKRWIEELVK